MVVVVHTFFLSSYGRKQFPLEALNAGADRGKPFSQPGAASACCCSGIVTATVTTTTPSNANAATSAIITIGVDVVIVVISLSPRGGRTVLVKR
jgi:hypothetical protein